MGQDRNNRSRIVLRVGASVILVAATVLVPWWVLGVFLLGYIIFFEQAYEMFLPAFLFDALYLSTQDIQFSYMTLWVVFSIFVVRHIKPRIAFFRDL